MVTVWDRVVRTLHWSIALLVFSEFFNEAGAPLHRWAGYLVVALVALRLGWGLVSKGHARFSAWWPTPSRLVTYLRAVRQGKTPRILGLNPLGACNVLLMWTLLLGLGVTGWMMGLDVFWGEERLEQVHETIAWILLAFVIVHIAAVIITSIKQRENLPRTMITGKKRPLDPPG